FDDGRFQTIPTKDYEHVKLGMCVSTHKGQGSTVDRAYVLAGGCMQDKEITYVQLSRAREKTLVYADEMSAGPELKTLARQMKSSRQKQFAHDIEAGLGEARLAEVRPKVRQETVQTQEEEQVQTLEL